MKISRKLNLVIPIDTDDGEMHVHSTPISREVFERYYLVLSKTFTRLYKEDLGVAGGPKVAAIMLRDIAQQMGEWDGPDGVQQGLVAEIVRLTNIILPGIRGWEAVPFQTVISQKRMDPEDVAEVESVITFFIVVSAMHRRSQVEEMLTLPLGLWQGQLTSSNSMEYLRSLPTLIEIVNSGETEITLSAVS